jgi:DNA modification methylase
MSGPKPDYDRDGITLYHGDCREILPTLAAGSVNAIVTDPPYGTRIEGDGYGRRQLYAGQRHIEGDESLEAMRGMLAEAPRILRPNSWVAAFCSPKNHAEASAVCLAAGLRIIGEAVWDKQRPGLGGGIRYQHEIILLCGHGEPVGKAALFSVLRGLVDRSKRFDGHPHEKPLSVICDLVRYCSEVGDTVLDPFLGSGTTLVACRKTGRRGIGIESDTRYIPDCLRRLEAAETPLLSGLEAAP